MSVGLSASLLTGEDVLSHSQTHREMNEMEATPLLGRGGLRTSLWSFPSFLDRSLLQEPRGSRFYGRLPLFLFCRSLYLQAPPCPSARHSRLVRPLLLCWCELRHPGSRGRLRPRRCQRKGAHRLRLPGRCRNNANRRRLEPG
ncbi:hypothetical protein NDU88_002189 [Pleurodeles waltl]|uniref:Uncharacterized protein n=1 Tax=Pleurodeles waltl TaxID=8319 RepID=A0AAV7UAN1_PLEWA|nr:hypothetical protein NDU88_002189 [Pleurodeles waltl]